MIVIGHCLDNGAWNFELSTRHIAHTRGTGNIATIMKSQVVMIIFRFIEFEFPFLNEVIGKLTNMLRYRIARIQKIKGPCKGVQETIGNTPGMAAFPKYDPLHLEVFSSFANPHRNLFHLLIGADEHAKIRRLRSIGADRPAHPRFMKHFGIAHQTINMGFGKKIG